MRYSDLRRGCMLFAKELKFNKALSQKGVAKPSYKGKDIDQMSRMLQAPVTLKIKVDSIHINRTPSKV